MPSEPAAGRRRDTKGQLQASCKTIIGLNGHCVLDKLVKKEEVLKEVRWTLGHLQTVELNEKLLE